MLNIGPMFSIYLYRYQLDLPGKRQENLKLIIMNKIFHFLSLRW